MTCSWISSISQLSIGKQLLHSLKLKFKVEIKATIHSTTLKKFPLVLRLKKNKQKTDQAAAQLALLASSRTPEAQRNDDHLRNL
jgi:hypothetical protein